MFCLMAPPGAEVFADRYPDVERVKNDFFTTPHRMQQLMWVLEERKDKGGAGGMELDHNVPVHQLFPHEPPESMASDKRVPQIGKSLEEVPLEAESKKEVAEQIAKGAYDVEEQRKAFTIPCDTKHCTVGCVVVDSNGNVAAGGSTGGLTNKISGRTGDTAVIGAGIVADNALGGIACSGTGEILIHHSVSNSVLTRMRLLKESMKEAAKAVIKELPDDAGGLIGIDTTGDELEVVFAKNTEGMYRGWVDQHGIVRTAIWDNDELNFDLNDERREEALYSIILNSSLSPLDKDKFSQEGINFLKSPVSSKPISKYPQNPWSST